MLCAWLSWASAQMALSLGYRESGDGPTSAVRGESSLGAPRLDGELLKLGVDISQGSVAKYLVRKQKPPSQTWWTFLENPKGIGFHIS